MRLVTNVWSYFASLPLKAPIYGPHKYSSVPPGTTGTLSS